ELTSPKSDAGVVAGALNRLGFEVIDKYDLSGEGMRRALAEFEGKAAGADWALIYFAGHGMQLAGSNWLIPVDAKLSRLEDTPNETIPLDLVLDRIPRAGKLRIVILDACRNNPFLPRMAMNDAAGRKPYVRSFLTRSRVIPFATHGLKAV